MSFFRKAFSFFNSRVLIEETINTQKEIYEGQKKMYPDMDLHDHLAQVWLSRMATFGYDPYEKASISAAYSTTFNFACIPPPKCIRALALFMVYKENEKAIVDNLQFRKEFETLMKPVYEAQDNDTWIELYAKYNPNRAKEIQEEGEEYYQNNYLISEDNQFDKKSTEEKKCGKDTISFEQLLFEDQDEEAHEQEANTKEADNTFEELFGDLTIKQGTLSWRNGVRYEGDVLDNRPHGQGKCTWPSGAEYVGEFREGKKHGQGMYSYPCGSRYTGQWENDQKHGQGTFFWSNGRVDKGFWENNKLVETHNYNYSDSYVRAWAKKNFFNLRNTFEDTSYFDLSPENIFIIMMYYLSAFAHPYPKDHIPPDQLSDLKRRKKELGMDASEFFSNDAALFEVGCYMNFRVDLWLYINHPNHRESLSTYLADRFIELFTKALGSRKIPKLFDQRMSGYGQLARAKADHERYYFNLSQLIFQIKNDQPLEDYSFDTAPAMIMDAYKVYGLKIELLSWEQGFIPGMYETLNSYCD